MHESENNVVSYDELERKAQDLKTSIENLVKEEVKNQVAGPKYPNVDCLKNKTEESLKKTII